MGTDMLIGPRRAGVVEDEVVASQDSPSAGHVSRNPDLGSATLQLYPALWSIFLHVDLRGVTPRTAAQFPVQKTSNLSPDSCYSRRLRSLSTAATPRIAVRERPTGYMASKFPVLIE